jgi:molybdate transport system regulatory protein
MADQPDLSVQVRILPLIGPGKMALLEGVDRQGSIAAAARMMGMAYPNAWKLLESMNGYFREPLVTRVIGGRRGGSASLTPTGRAVLDIFRSMETKAKIMFASDVDALNLLLAPASTRQSACDPIEGGIGSQDCSVKKEGATGRGRPGQRTVPGVQAVRSGADG